ncbi:xylanase inhibitor protein XIP-like [Oryza brachyantha]|uniref:GH18 domain-containing protein n=1 Tax=Oryza brachyantha TaxID=4533 RepID=J3M594_ORYBR|nr:xylanase inhibitor protein XIP-like [Oryza brachyantha]
MAFRRPVAPLLVLLLSSCLAAGPAPATAQSTGDTVVFWGRNSDQQEGSLAEACDTGLYTTVFVSFLSAFGHGTYKLDLSGHALSAVGPDIKHCQSRGILVLLAIGGQGGEYSLPSSQAAVDLEDYLWNAFLGGGRQGVARPFGDAVVDGVDFFIDQGATEHYDELARRLYAHNKDYKGRLGVMLTATARCGYPDQRLQAALATGLFSRIHVKVFGDGRCAAGRREELEKWMAAYPQSRVLVGVVASPEADREAYLSHKDLYYDVLQFINKLPNFGGIMVWNRYWDRKTGWTAGNEPGLQQMK